MKESGHEKFSWVFSSDQYVGADLCKRYLNVSFVLNNVIVPSRNSKIKKDEDVSADRADVFIPGRRLIGDSAAVHIFHIYVPDASRAQPRQNLDTYVYIQSSGVHLDHRPSIYTHKCYM